MNFIGKWICDTRFASLTPLHLYHKEHEPFEMPPHPPELKNVHMLVRKTFVMPAFQACILRIAADDYYKLYINGRFVAKGAANGYHFHYYYNEMDVSAFLREGENVIAAEVYYPGLVNRVWNSGDLRQGMAADLIADGKILLCTDETWKYTISRAYTSQETIGYQTQFVEDYDSNLEETGWRECGFDDAGWEACAVRETDYTFCDTPAPVVVVYPQAPIVTKKLEDGRLFYDFGREITGMLRITARGKKGNRIRILCGEELSAPFTVRYQMRCNCDYEEYWTLGEGMCKLEQYDYKAFRYVCLEPDASVEILSLSADVCHYPFDDDACSLQSSDPILEQVFELCKNGVKYGCQDVYTDCPSREKGQYAGDLTVSSASQIYLTGDLWLFKKAIGDQAASQKICPGIMAVTPGSFMQEIADYSLQFPILVLRCYQHTGDLDFLREMLPVCRQMLNYFRQYRRPDGLLEQVDGKWNLVDWPENLRDGYDFPLTKPIGPGCHNVINAFYVGSIGLTEQIADLLGEAHDREYTALSAAFNRAFFNPDTGLYTDREGGSHSALHSNMIPAYFGFHPAAYSESIADFLTGKGVCCGVYMSYFLLKALARLGRYDTVYRLITSTGENSWYNMVREGGTTCFEAWGKEQKRNTSLCHPWASAPVSVLIEDLIGLSPSIPGWKEIRCTPHLPGGPFALSMKIPTAGGTVTVTCQNGETKATFKERNGKHEKNHH